ncbi:MAG: hypothetical protein HXX13_17700 [Bacteroidetes bacterium]|nr:hypothetical protein [Bacteroidota bacterium]
MLKKRANILSILIPILFLIGEMIISLIFYPIIFEKVKWSAITICIAIVTYILLWNYLKPDRYSKVCGLIIGLLFIINISIEEFINWKTQASTLISTLSLMFLIFVSFSVISGIRTIKSENITAGVKSSFSSSLLGTIIALCYGFLINFLFSDRMVFILKGYPGYSDFSNPRAFTFFNSFDNASNHVIIAPIISIIMGIVGGWTALIFLNLKRKKNLNN